jgi:hypothetical protein
MATPYMQLLSLQNQFGLEQAVLALNAMVAW